MRPTLLLLLTVVLCVAPAAARPMGFVPVDSVSVTVDARTVARFAHALGVVVSPVHVLTNAHVAQMHGERTTVLLGGTEPRVALLAAAAPELDLALYTLEVPADAWMVPRRAPPAAGEAVMVLGHPGSGPPTLSFGTVLSAGLQPGGVPSIEYDAQTDWGSSGSAVLDAQGQLIAVHWAWDSNRLYNGWMLGVPLAEARARWPALATALGSPPSG